MDIDFKEKIVIVTGASSGIGAESAKIFADYEAKLTLVGRDETRLNEVAQECQSKKGHKPLCLLLDLTHPESCETVINRTLEVYGKIDVLINCAGKLKMASIFDQSIEVFDELIAINLRVPYYLSQLVVPHLRKTKGSIVNVGSSISHRYRPGFLPYCISKNGLQRFTEQAATETSPEGVRINTINPGPTRTNFLHNINIDKEFQPYVYNMISEQLPTGVIMEAKEVATLICLIASNLFPEVNGANIELDGTSSLA